MLLSEAFRDRLKKLAGIVPGQIKKVNFYILIGPPAIGKSTFINTMPVGTLVINRDDIVQQTALRYNLTYDDLFVLPPAESQIGSVVPGYESFGKVVESPESIRNWAPVSFENIYNINTEVFNKMSQLFQKAKSGKFQNVVIDMTNMTLDSRSKILNTMQDKVRFRYIAVNFDISDPETINIIKKVAEIRRTEDLRKGIKKTIPDSTYQRMFMQYVQPSFSEGFDKIININTIDKLKQFIVQSQV